jgi:hypothetical protein
MKLKKPIQAADNPHDIVENPMAWARHEYEASRGSMHGLVDAAKRYSMMQAILNDCNRCGIPKPPDSIVIAMSYLLEVPFES